MTKINRLKKILINLMLLLAVILSVACQDENESLVEESVGNSGTRLELSVVNDGGSIKKIVDNENKYFIKARVTDWYGSPLAGKQVEFNVSLGVLTPSSGAALTDSNGVAKIQVLAGNQSGASKATATVTVDADTVVTSYAYTVKSDNLEGVTLSKQGTTLKLSIVNTSGLQIKTLALDEEQFLQALLLDSNGLPFAGQKIMFDAGIAQLFPASGSALTNKDGVAQVKLLSGGELGASYAYAWYSTEYDYVQSEYAYEIVQKIGKNSVIGTEGQLLTITMINELDETVNVVSALSNQYLKTTLLDQNGLPIADKKVKFSTELGLLSPGTGTALTDSNGTAVITLLAGEFLGAARATASVDFDGHTMVAGYEFQVTTVENEIEESLAPNVSRAEDGTKIKLEIINADGVLINNLPQDTSQSVVATVTNRNGDPVVGRKVAFSTELGALEPTTKTALTDANGKATVRLLAGRTVGASQLTATVLVKEESLVAKFDFAIIPQVDPGSNTNTRNLPNSISIFEVVPHIFVKGVGEDEVAYIKFKVVDANGNIIGEPDSGVNNVRATLTARPYGGELLHGLAASGEIVSTNDTENSITFSTKGGEATVTLQSGTLPGAVEIELEILDFDGSDLAAAVSTKVSQIVISSGPPHNIVLTTSHRVEKVENLEGGLYRQIGAVTVTDRHGNPVPDGTVVHLGVIDTVLARGEFSGSTSGTNVLADLTQDFVNAYAYRNFNYRFIEPLDRVLINNTNNEKLPTDESKVIHVGDRTRFVKESPTGATSLVVTKDYYGSNDELSYLVGASALGASVFGTNMKGERVSGSTTTIDGVGTVYMTYPSDAAHILTGCWDVPYVDRRHTLPPFTSADRSADVYIVASSNDTGISAVSYPGQFCYNAISPIHISTDTSKITELGTHIIRVTAHDSILYGDGVALPYLDIRANVATETKTDFTVTATHCFPVNPPFDMKDPDFDSSTLTQTFSGDCYSTIVVEGGDTGDIATVEYHWGGYSTAVQVVR